MGDFSVKAVLSAVDKNFSSTMKSALGYTNNLKSTLTSGIGFGVMMGIGQKAFSAVTNSAVGLVREIDSSNAAWKTFTSNMQMVGKSTDEITGVKKELQAFAEQTIYSSSDMASTFSQLEAVGTKNTTKLVKGFGGLAAAAENPQQAMKTLSQQATQMAAKPTVAWMDFKLMLEQTPAGIAAVAKQMGKTTSQLVSDVQDGKVSTEEFFDAISEVGTNDAFTKLATTYKTAGQAMDGLNETIANKLTPSFDVLSGVAISSISNIIDNMSSLDGDAIASRVSGFITNVGRYWSVFKTDFIEVKDAFGDAASAIIDDVYGMTGAFGSSESVSNFSDVLGIATGALTTFAGFCKEHSKTIAKVITILPKLYIAYKGFQIVRSVAPFVGTFSKGILMLAGKGVGAIAGKLLGIGAAEKVVGESSAVSAKQMLQSATAFLALGAGVALICAGFWLLSSAAVNLANAGPLAIATMLGMTVAVGALLLVAKSVAPTLSAGAIGFVAFGAAVVLAGAGMMLMTNAAISLANAGPLAIGVMVGMVAAIALLAVGAAALGPALTIGAVGFIAFGAAILLVGAGALLASAALSVVAGVLPTVVQYGAQGAVAIMALGVGMTVFAAGATLAGAGCIVLGAGLLVATAGLLAFSAGIVVTSAGILVLAASLTAVNSSMKSIAKNAKSAQTSLNSMKSSTSVVSSGLDAIGSKAKSAMNSLISAFDGAASKSSSSGKKVGSGFNSGLNTGMVAAIGTANSGTAAIISTLNTAGNRSYSCGVYIGRGLANGMRSQLGVVRSVASQLAEAAEAAIRAKAKINSPSKVAEKLGGYWGSGWAGGMLAKAKDAWKAAQELVRIPDVVASRQDFSFAGGYGNMDLSEAYNYYSESKYTIVVPVNLEGREIARASAEYTQEELEKGDNLKNMLKGVRNV